MYLPAQGDFDLDRIAVSGQCFRWEPTEGGGYRIPFRDRCLHIRNTEDGGYMLDCSESEFRTLWRDYFDLETDYAVLRDRVDAEQDPFLFRAVQAGRGIRILRQDPWETLVSFIISQNRNIPAIRRSVELLCRAAGECLEDLQGQVFHTFPAPERILRLEDAALASCRLGYRAKYVRAAARAVAEGSLSLDTLAEAPEEETMTALMGLFGVGIKVASCVSLFGFHHLDAFPVDVWIRRVLETEYPDGYPRDRYSPYNGVYQQYMFACYRSQGKEKSHG